MDEKTEDIESKKDPEQLKFMNLIDSVEPKLTELQKMDLLIKWKKEYQGVKGFHLSVNPWTTSSNEEIAHDFMLIQRSMAEGKYEIVTDLDGY